MSAKYQFFHEADEEILEPIQPWPALAIFGPTFYKKSGRKYWIKNKQIRVFAGMTEGYIYGSIYAAFEPLDKGVNLYIMANTV